MKCPGEALCDQDHRALRDAVKRIAALEAALAGIEVKLARDQDVDGAMRILLAVKK